MTTLMQNAPISGIAGANLTGMEGRLVKPNSAGKWVLAGLGEVGLPLVVGGAADTAVAIGAPGNIHRVVAGGAVTAGNYVKADANGKGVNAAATSVSGAAVVGSAAVGLALTGVTNADEVFDLLVMPVGLRPTTAA